VLQHPWVSGGIARSQNFSQHHTNRIRLLQAKRKLRRNVQIIIACNRFASILQIAASLDKEAAPSPSPSPILSRTNSPTKSVRTFSSWIFCRYSLNYFFSFSVFASTCVFTFRI